MTLSRREFLGVAAAAPLALKSSGEQGTLPARTFGRSGVRLPILAFGCGSRFLSYENDDEAIAVLNRAIDLGVTYVDTAHNYGGGKSEERVGRVVKTRRKEVFLATKLDARTADAARRQIELSLKRLNTDRLDVLHVHGLESLDDLAAIEAKGGVLEAVLEARDQKVARLAGITGHADPVAMKAALERHDFDCVQMALNVSRARIEFDDDGARPVSMAEKSYEALALPVATTKNLGVIAMKVFGQDRLQSRAPAGKLLYYALSLPVALASVGMPKPELLDRNVALARAFRPLDESEMKQLRASVAAAQRTALARFFRDHRDA
ncbi:MAG TPA: aldo/keto reductase [Vicinamibacteria bacterium]|nr:aldo/keto reductase [Vicinamibacteria bacterium]